MERRRRRRRAGRGRGRLPEHPSARAHPAGALHRRGPRGLRRRGRLSPSTVRGEDRCRGRTAGRGARRGEAAGRRRPCPDRLWLVVPCPATNGRARPRPLHPFVATRRVGLYWAGQEQRSGLLSTRKVLPSCLTLNHSCHGALGPWLVRLMMSSHAFSMHFRAFWRRHGCDGAARTALLRMGVLGRVVPGMAAGLGVLRAHLQL